MYHHIQLINIQDEIDLVILFVGCIVIHEPKEFTSDTRETSGEIILNFTS